MIAPTVGRIVWFYPAGIEQKISGEQPRAAQIAHVHGDRLINIGYLDQHGIATHATDVALLQEGDVAPAEGGFCEWMPYQVNQAKKDDAPKTDTPLEQTQPAS